MKNVRAILGILILFLCYSEVSGANVGLKKTSVDQSFVRSASIATWVEKGASVPPTTRSDPIVIRLADTQVQNGKELSIYYSRAIQVNDREALKFIGQYSISYVPDYERLFIHQVAILRNGQVRDQTSTAKMQMLQREQQLEAGMLGGQATLQMLLDDVRVGDTLLVSYTISGKNPVFDGRWASTFGWDSGVPVEHRRLLVSHDRERPLYWAQRGDFKTQPILFKVESSAKSEKLIFEERALDAVEEEPNTPSDYLPGRVLEFSEYRDWNEVAAWGDKIFPVQAPNPDINMLVQKFSREATPEKRAAAALRWVQNEIRYFSVSLGENSHKPRASGLVLKTRFGDCKDKSYLLVALLGGLGLKAEPVLVSAGAPKYPSGALPSPLVFDHVVVRTEISGNTYFLDATRTGQTEALDQLPVAVPNGYGLVVQPLTEKLTILPDDRHDFPQFELAEHFLLSSLDGEGKLEARRTYRADYAAAMRRAFSGMSASMLGKYALGMYEKSYPGLTLSAPPSFIEEDGNTVLVTRYSIPHPLTLSDGRYELAVTNKVLEGVIDLPDKIVRNYPFSPSAGKFRGRHLMQVTWPERSRIANEINAKTLDNSYFRYHREYFLRGNTLHYQMDFANKLDRLAASDMPKLQLEANRLEKMAIGSFSVDADSLLKAHGMELRYRDIEGSISATAFKTQAPSWAENPGSHSAEDWCLLLAQAYLGINFMPEKERDKVLNFRSQEMVKAERKELKRCVGGLAFMRQDFPEAVRYWTGDSLEDSDRLLPRMAWARLFQGDEAGALKDMKRHYESRLASGIDTAADLIQYAALSKRAKSGMPDQVKTNLADRSSSVWPRPVAAFLAGTVDADALLASAETLPRDAREFAMAEAWYYIGVDRLVGGDKKAAQQAFRFVVANGVPSTIEYMLAKAELDLLWGKDPDYVLGAAAEIQKEYSVAAKYYEKAMLRGDAQATYSLALFYYYGDGMAVDKVRAFSLIHKAAEGDIPGAQNMMGVYYNEESSVVARNVEEAAKWFKLSADQYDLHGMNNFGDLLAKKSQVNSPDFARAIGYLQQSAGMGSHDAQADLGKQLQFWNPATAVFWIEFATGSGNAKDLLLLVRQIANGDPALRDGKRARRILSPLAQAGNTEAQLQLGMMFEYGQGIEKNPELALKWFEQAAKAGSSIGKMRVARMYLYGQGVEKDVKKAIGLLREAAAGAPYANYLLADLYQYGNGVEADPKQATAYYQRAAENGFAEGYTAIGNMFYFGNGGREQAVEWYRKGAQSGSGVSTNNLGDMYENGVGVAQDFMEAMKLYRQAAEMGASVGFRSLASMYSSGKAGKIDLQQAYLYYLLATKIDTTVDEGLNTVKQKLTADDLHAMEAKAEKWKPGDPLPSMNL